MPLIILQLCDLLLIGGEAEFCLTELLDGRSVGQEIVLLGKILGRGRDWMAREEAFLN
jgi:hypothetical protein